MIRLILLSLLLTAVPVVAAPLPPAALPSDSVYLLDASLTNQAGQKSTWRQQRGKPRVVTMFYSSCPYMCPLIVDSAKAIEHTLSTQERARLGITLVSIDPRRDTPRALAALAVKRKLDPALWSLLQPAASDVRALAAVLGIRYRALANGEFNHTSVLILIDGNGRILARTEKIGSKLEPDFVARVHRALRAPGIVSSR